MGANDGYLFRSLPLGSLHAAAGLPGADSLACLAHRSASVAALINVLRVSLWFETEELL